MPAATYNFDIEQGSDLRVVFQYIDENNTLVNMTNFYVSLVFSTNENQTYYFDNTTPTVDYQLLTDTPGYIRLFIPARMTNTYNFVNATYDLDIQEPNEEYPGSCLKRYRLSQGNIGIIKRNVPVTLNNCNTIINSSPIIDACSMNCSSFYSSIYAGSSIIIKDNDTTTSTIFVQDNRTIDYVEIAINGLNHTNPQDLNFFLAPPSGNKILLSAGSKIKNYRPGFSYMVSDRAPPLSTINNVMDGGVCRIVDKTHFIKFDNTNPNLSSSFDHLRGYIPSSGNWDLCVTDMETSGSGIIDSWKLIITYVEV